MTLPRTITGWLLVGLLGGALAQGCGSSSKTHRPEQGGPGAGSGGKDSGSMTVEPPGVSGADGESKYDPLCGVLNAATCVPDEVNNSMCVAAPSGKGGGGGSGGGGSSAGAGTGGTGKATGGTGAGGSGTGGTGTGTGGTAGSSSPGASGGSGGTELAAGAGGEGGVQSAGGASEGGVGATAGGAPSELGGQAGGPSAQGGAGEPGIGGAGSSGQAGSPDTGETGGRSSETGGTSAGRSSGDNPASGVSCQVIENTKHKGTPVAVCGPAGTGTEGSPCFSGEDCAPSLACVGDGPGQCRAYCCSGAEQCGLFPGTHCTEEPLVLASKPSRVLSVPVCMPAVKCNLAEPYPCDSGTCSCPKDSACVVVSDDGTTSCVPRSELPSGEQGTQGKPCPCAPGFVCAENACVQLCEVAAAESKCASGRCQAASGALPAGWGTCVGDAPKDAGAP
jgi:hypothetical protein